MFYGEDTFGSFRPARPDVELAPVSWDEAKQTFKAAFRDVQMQAGMAAHDAAMEQALDDYIGRVKDATGTELVSPYRHKLEMPAVPLHHLQDSFDAQRRKLAEQYPDQRDIILPQDDLQQSVFDEMKRREAAAADAVEHSPWTAGHVWGMPLNPAALAGSIAGGMTDPAQALINLITGPMGRVGAGAKAVLWNALKMGAANATVEAAQQPLIQSWRAKAGMEYGADLAATSIATSALFGFGLDASVRGASRGLGLTRGFDLDEAAKALPENSPVRRAANGDVAALNEVAKAAGVADEPAVRGARQALELDDGLGLHVEGVDDYNRVDFLTQLLRNAEDDREPLPGRPEATPEARGPVLSDHVDAPVARGETFVVDGKPVTFRDFRPASLSADPDTFQFRSADRPRLTGAAAWDDAAAGKVIVFERANGEQVIADGHHRLDLARRLSEQGPELQGYLFREADGWSADDVAALAAKKNLIDSPRLDVVDAARVLRERPDLFDRSLPAGDETLRQARAIAKLSDEAFGMVQAGAAPASHGALVGKMEPHAGRHASHLRALAAAAPDSPRAARLTVADLMQQPGAGETQLIMLGRPVDDELPSLRAGGFDEPGGPEARLQVEQLEREFAEDIERQDAMLADAITEAEREVHLKDLAEACKL